MVDGGYTPREIDKFTLADVNLVYAEWGRLPPLRVMVAAGLGIIPTAAPDPKSTPATTSVAVLRAMYPDGLMR
jgi:hypothetical protein